MALSSKDTAAVKKAATAGGLSASAGNAVVKSANAAGTVAAPPVPAAATAKAPAASFGGQQFDPIRAPGDRIPNSSGTEVTQPQDPTAQGAVQPTVATGQPNIQNGVSTIKDPLTGQSFTRDTANPNSTYQPADKYKQGLAAAQASGTPAPADAGQARVAVSQYTPPQQDTTAVDNYVSTDPNVNNLMQGITKLLNPQVQTTSLLDDYQKLYKQSGLDQINHEIIDAETVINGTEGDIRNEIQAAGGFGTDSQVQAMSLSRNKSLLTRYNQLVQQKTDATNQLNTLTNLNAQDKQMAQTRINTQIGAMFNLANFQQQAQKNTQEAFNNMVAKVGYSGAYAAYASDPRQLGMIEQVMGLQSGGLQKLAAQPDLDRQLKQAQINSANRANQPSAPNMQFVAGTANQPAGTFNPATGAFTPIKTSSTTGPEQLAVSQSNIQLADSLNNSPGLAASVGPNSLARVPWIAGFTGAQSNFLAGAQQLQNQLTLQNLQNAKANGATFGALSEGELNLLASSGSKLNSWAIKGSDGNVTGYNTTEQNFKSEIDKINNFQKLDYVLKGGSPDSVGVVEHPDGTLWTMNSNGTMTEIR